MKKQLLSWLRLLASFTILLVAAIAVNQLYSLSVLLNSLLPYSGYAFLALWALFFAVTLFTGLRLWRAPKLPPLADRVGV